MNIYDGKIVGFLISPLVAKFLLLIRSGT